MPVQPTTRPLIQECLSRAPPDCGHTAHTTVQDWENGGPFGKAPEDQWPGVWWVGRRHTQHSRRLCRRWQNWDPVYLPSNHRAKTFEAYNKSIQLGNACRYLARRRSDLRRAERWTCLGLCSGGTGERGERLSHPR